MKTILFLFLFVFVYFAQSTTYRIPRRTFDNIIDEKHELSDRTARNFLFKFKPNPQDLTTFMDNVPLDVRSQVWSALDIMFAEPGESLECLVTGNACIEAGLFLFYKGKNVARVVYDSGREPAIWYVDEISKRAWDKDTGYLFVYADNAYGNHYFKTNMELPVYTPHEKNLDDQHMTITYTDSIVVSNSTNA